MKSYVIASSDAIFIDEEDRPELLSILKQVGREKSLIDGILTLPQGYIGNIITSNLNITLKPSVRYLRAIDYLRLVDDYTDVNDDDNSAKWLGLIAANDISNYLVEKFYFYLKTLASKGVPKRYLTQKQFSQHFAGNIDFEQTLFRNTVQYSPIVATKRSVLNSDYIAMQVIKAAFIKVSRAGLIDHDSNIQRVVMNVKSSRSILNAIPNIELHFGRHEDLLKVTFDIAKMIIENLNISTNNDDLGSSLLVNSNTIFENYIAHLLKFVDPVHFHYKTHQKVIANKSGNSDISIEPDLIYSGLNKAVLDVKNKDFEEHFNNADLYQLLTYCNNFDSKVGILIYPYNKDLPPVKVIYNKQTDLLLYAVGCNITGRTRSERDLSVQTFFNNIKELLHFC